MNPPPLFRITDDSWEFMRARRVETLWLDESGEPPVAIADEVRWYNWRDLLGESVHIFRGEICTPSYRRSLHSCVLTRRCVDPFVTKDDQVFDVDLSPAASQGKKKRDWSAFDYVAMVPHGGVDTVVEKCRYDWSRPYNKSLNALVDTWDGTHFVTNRENSHSVYCSLRVVETARAERWTGFAFQPADLPTGLQAHWNGVDYLGEEWPPRRWYPPDPATFTGVQDWIAALNEVGPHASRWISFMRREMDDWASQEAIDWIAAYITENEPGTVTVDNAGLLYLYLSSKNSYLLSPKYEGQFRFDPKARERAWEINLETRSLSWLALRKRYQTPRDSGKGG